MVMHAPLYLQKKLGQIQDEKKKEKMKNIDCIDD